jgi:hypothetical protein
MKVKLLASLLITVFVTSCAPAATPTADVNAIMTQAARTVIAQMTLDPSPTPTGTPVPTATAVRTPPALPAVFQTGRLNPLDTPHTYIKDACQYLKMKWDPNNAAPGTVVMAVMFHSIIDGAVSDPNQIDSRSFAQLMRDMKDQGFEAIDTQQLADFLDHNARIPPRSAILIVDDRHARQYFDVNFHKYFEDWGWKVVNSWISTPLSTEDLWNQQVALETEGWVDHEAHGVIHNINITSSSSDDFITSEMKGSIDAFMAHFGKKPIAYIWPGGSFTPHAAQIGRQLGYQLGFTINPRGPILFNWVPLSDKADPMRPSYLPEGAVDDPLMVLPRYWDVDARLHLDDVRKIGKEAAAYAEQNKDTELTYYDIVCAPTYGPMPTAPAP